MSFDRLTHELWVGDVGQDMWEEIDIVRKGGNYGWSIREGKHEFNITRGSKDPLIDPVLDYPHKPIGSDKSAAYGPCLTGGYVYRGKKLKGMDGAYLYADYVLGWVRALRADKGQVTADESLIEQPENLSSFAEDIDGELFILGYSNGRIYRLEP
jgi:glucose/arabinose dehydrogenase